VLHLGQIDFHAFDITPIEKKNTPTDKDILFFFESMDLIIPFDYMSYKHLLHAR
jgi:hypothetical protein